MSEPSGAGRGRKARGGLSRARRRRGTKSKVRTTPFPTRLHHHPEARTPSPGGGDVQPPRAAQYRQLRRERLIIGFRAKGGSISETVQFVKCSCAAVVKVSYDWINGWKTVKHHAPLMSEVNIGCEGIKNKDGKI
ncbi:proline-rich nuclear receptor coactivator 1 isoform 2-T2 [Discoglossus pictus]